jgi:hypothetical protein
MMYLLCGHRGRLGRLEDLGLWLGRRLLLTVVGLLLRLPGWLRR